MGNSTGRCICYTENKRLCWSCNIKYCDKCLTPKYGTTFQHSCELRCCYMTIRRIKEIYNHYCPMNYSPMTYHGKKRWFSVHLNKY